MNHEEETRQTIRLTRIANQVKRMSHPNRMRYFERKKLTVEEIRGVNSISRDWRVRG